MEHSRRSTEALAVAVLMLAMSLTALAGLGYIIHTGTASGSFQTLTVLLNTDPTSLEKDIPEGSDGSGMFGISVSTHKVGGSVSYEVEGGEAYMMVCDGSEHFRLKASTDCNCGTIGLTIYEDGMVVGGTSVGENPGSFEGEFDRDTVYKVRITSFCGLTYDEETGDWDGVYNGSDVSGNFSLSLIATEIRME